MAELAEVWARALSPIKEGVTGVGVWTALNAAVPVAVEEGVFVLGLPSGYHELSGHLKMPSTKRLIDITMSQMLGETVSARIIEGTEKSDWELVKRRDGEARRLNDQAMQKMRAELESRTSWESVYEQLARKFASISNKSLPQNRARFFLEAVELVAEGRKSQPNWDDMAERNFARCIERLAQYADVPSVIVAIHVLQQAGEM